MWTDQIRSSGFAIVPDVVPHEQVQQLRFALDGTEVTRRRAGARHLMGNPSVAGIANNDHLLKIAQTSLGGNVRPYRATLFDKSPESNWLVVWHQDTALPLKQRAEVPGWGPWSVKSGVVYAHAPAAALERVLALRLHLDDSTLENGPLRVLSATHSRGVLSDDEIEYLSKRISPVDCVVEAGGVVAMRPLIVHASSKSTGELPRRVLHIEYAAGFELEGGLELAVA